MGMRVTENSVLLTRCCCEPKTALKKKNCLIKNICIWFPVGCNDFYVCTGLLLIRLFKCILSLTFCLFVIKEHTQSQTRILG